MRLYLYLILLFSFSFSSKISSANNDSGLVVISGTLRNFSNQMQVGDMSELEELVPASDLRTFIPDSSGKFSVEFMLNRPGYFRIGRNILYLSPGDSLIMDIDYRDPEKLVISGRSKLPNEYLRFTLYPHAGSFMDGGISVKPSIEETVQTVMALAKEKEKSLRNQKGLSSEFRQLESARIRADIINSLRTAKGYYADVHKIAKDSLPAFFRQYDKMVDPLIDKYMDDFVDPKFLVLEVYRHIAKSLVEHSKDDNIKKAQVKDWLRADSLATSLTRIKEKQKAGSLKPLINQLNNKDYRSALGEMLNSVLRFGNGDKAINFEGIDPTGAVVQLKNFTGKIIYIDIWATWCGPCLEEMPLFEKLKEKYKTRDDIVFISLSIDVDKNAWKKNLLDRNASGHQWFVDRGKLNEYSIFSVPRAIVIDRSFTVAALDGPTPKESSVNVLLDSLMK